MSNRFETNLARWQGGALRRSQGSEGESEEELHFVEVEFELKVQ
jgi:hypothetical protein